MSLYIRVSALALIAAAVVLPPPGIAGDGRTPSDMARPTADGMEPGLPLDVLPEADGDGRTPSDMVQPSADEDGTATLAEEAPETTGATPSAVDEIDPTFDPPEAKPDVTVTPVCEGESAVPAADCPPETE